MADTDETTGSVATARADKAAKGNKPGTGKSAMRRKVVSGRQTSLSSRSPVVLPSETPPLVPTAAAKPDLALNESAAEADMEVSSIADTLAVGSSAGTTPELPVEPVVAKAKAAEPEAVAELEAVGPETVEPTALTPTDEQQLPPVTTESAAIAPEPVSDSEITKPEPSIHANLSPFSSIKDLTMDMSANFTGFQDAMGQAQAKAQAAFEKSSNLMGEAGEFAKGNVEAMIQSSKIFAEGMQQIGSTMVAESRTAFEAMTGDIKELASAKSPTDFVKLQSEMVRKNFDSAVAYGSKNTETYLKLMSDAFAPLSSRVSLAVEKARQVAPSMPMNAAA